MSVRVGVTAARAGATCAARAPVRRRVSLYAQTKAGSGTPRAMHSPCTTVLASINWSSSDFLISSAHTAQRIVLSPQKSTLHILKTHDWRASCPHLLGHGCDCMLRGSYTFPAGTLPGRDA